MGLFDWFKRGKKPQKEIPKAVPAKVPVEKGPEKNEEMKKLLKEYGLKGSLSVRDHRTVVLTIKSGVIDFASGNSRTDGIVRSSVNVYWIDEHWTGKAKKFLTKAKALLNAGNYDNSDIMTDYFDVGWYVDINLGKWNQPYVYTPKV